MATAADVLQGSDDRRVGAAAEDAAASHDAR